MKIITLRIDEEEKARLEQLAEAGDVTLSRALREGASLYLTDIQGRVHRSRGGDATFHGLRRDKHGRPLAKRSKPTPVAAARAAGLREALYNRGLRSVQQAWEDGSEPAIVLSAVAHWLSLVGEVYVSQPNQIGWDWFLRDYCPEYSERSERTEVQRVIGGSLVHEATLNVSALLGSLDSGFLRLLDEAEHYEIVRRAILPTWDVLERRLRG